MKVISRCTFVRRLARIAGYAAVLVIVAWMAAVLASPGARRGYGLWLTARSMDLSADIRERASADVSVNRMPMICSGGPCPGVPMGVGVTLPPEAVRGGVDADSAWVLVGPVVYPVRVQRLRDHPALSSPHWSGDTWTEMGPDGLPVGVVVRFREPGQPPRVLRFTGVRVGSTW